jgi:hypothetical protein
MMFMKLIMVIIVLLSNQINPDAFDPNWNQTEGQKENDTSNLNFNKSVKYLSEDYNEYQPPNQINSEAFDPNWGQIDNQKENDASNLNVNKPIQDSSVDWIFVFIIKLVMNPYSALIAIGFNMWITKKQIENSMKKKTHKSQKLGPVENSSSSSVTLLYHIRREIRQEMFTFHHSDIFNNTFIETQSSPGCT